MFQHTWQETDCGEKGYGTKAVETEKGRYKESWGSDIASLIKCQIGEID